MPESGLNAETMGVAEARAGMLAWTNPAMAAWGHVGEAYMKACAEWQQEVVRFLGARVNADMSAQQALAACRSWTDAGKLQQDWAATTMQDYLDESGRLFDIATRCAQGMCGAAVSAAPATLDAAVGRRAAS